MKEIETKRFVLKLLEEKYINNIFTILNNEHVVQTLNMKRHTKLEDTINMLRDYYEGLKNKEKYPYEIIDKNNNEFIGVFLIKLDLYDEDCFEFTIYLDEKFWNKGVYTEILPYMVDVAFKEIKTGNFRGFVMEKNLASKRVLEKCGFKLEKIFKVEGIEGNIYSYLKRNSSQTNDLSI